MNPGKSQPMISAKGLTRIYKLGDSEVIGINRVDLEIAAGALVVLKGNSGSGKSTLLSLLAGLDRPTRGDLTVANHDLNKSSDGELTHFRRQVVLRGPGDPEQDAIFLLGQDRAVVVVGVLGAFLSQQGVSAEESEESAEEESAPLEVICYALGK